MKQRIVSAIVGLAILAVVLLGFETLLLNTAVSLISILALYELFHAAGRLRHRQMAAATWIYAGLFPFFREFFDYDLLPLVSLLYLLAMLAILLRNHRTIRFQDVLTAGAFGVMISASFTNVVLFRNNNGWLGGVFCVMILLGSAWFSDTCAYFTGRAFGKHKMAPVISPHKTVEGLIGGLIGSVVCNLLMAWALSLIFQAFGVAHTVQYFAVAAGTLLGSAASVIGDLTASTIKRQCGVKDFGNIMPGHGGVMDRFDSVLMVSPVIYLFSCFVPLIII